MVTNKVDLIPVFAGHVVLKRNLLTVETQQQSFAVNIPTSLGEELLYWCTGQHTLQTVLIGLGKKWSGDEVVRLIDALFTQGALIDARSLGKEMLQKLRNPSSVPIYLSDECVNELMEEARFRQVIEGSNNHVIEDTSNLLRLLHGRKSCRHFSSEQICLDVINKLVFAAYGAISERKRTVPSAGALYPLQVHLVLNRSSESLRQGIYRVVYGLAGQLSYQAISDMPTEAIRAFLDQLTAHHAHGLIVISGNQYHQAVKYGPRALLYTVLEAGHAAQNIHLAAQEECLGTVEIGGFAEVLLAHMLGLDAEYQPLTTVLFGRPQEAADTDDVEIKWEISQRTDYVLPFSVAMARLAPEVNSDWSYGRDYNPQLAAIKARAEAREWAACAFVHDTTVKALVSELDTWIHPNDMVAFHPAQYRVQGFPLTRFNASVPQYWAVATNENTGNKTRVLADLVYFPYESGQPPCGYANSSGVAAHPSRQQAVESATLELMERDAFMIAYLGRISHPRVSKRTLSVALQKRIGALETIGCDVSVVDITLDLAPVIMVMVMQKEWHFMNVAAASRFNSEEAVSHALMEVEASVLARMENGPAQSIAPHAVGMPGDHGSLYEQERYYRRADFLVASGEVRSLKDVGNNVAQNWNQLQRSLVSSGISFYTIDYHIPVTHGGNAGLHIVRAIAPGLVPMTFGYRQEPAGMRRLYKIASRSHGRDFTYKDAIKFPHPFA